MSTSAADHSDEHSLPSRYVVGIDLGTTNSAVCFIDNGPAVIGSEDHALHSVPGRATRKTSTPGATAGLPSSAKSDSANDIPFHVKVFPVPQLVAPGQVDSQDSLPSFHYEPLPDEAAQGAYSLPWQKSAGKNDSHAIVGVLAREQARLVPGRAISSAKSWLCHSGIDRTAAVLPWQGASDVERLSPVDASSRYIGHIRAAWDHAHPDEALAEQDIVLTLPASFDEVARELTVQAAKDAGLNRIVLIEEPQAAFYAWIDQHRDDWEDLVTPGQKILVCDIGGGTSDFTLIKVRKGDGDKIVFHRVAVGEHLILGGDNLDLALAHDFERRFADGDDAKKLEPRQWSVLVRACRAVKEELLSTPAPEAVSVTLPGSGSRLIGGSLQLNAPGDDARALLTDGFLPSVKLTDAPDKQTSGFREFGLPYAADAAITKYLAAFLTAHRNVTVGDDELPTGHDPARPDIVLFNGGFFASDILRQRLLNVLSGWFRSDSDPDWSPVVLRNDRLDLAVAQGAAYYGMVRRGQGVRIAAGLARTYYVGVENDKGIVQALCLLPAGLEPPSQIEIESPTFTLRVDEPIEFPLFVSSTRLTDRTGDVIAVDPEQIKALPPIRTVLKTRKKADAATVAVRLQATLTELGTLELSCREIDGRRSWRLQFDVRSATQTDIAAHESNAEAEGVLADEDWQACVSILNDTFGDGTTSQQATAKPARVAKSMAKAISLSRSEWPTSLLRNIWEHLLDREAGRRKSAEHEARWLNLLGFSLRPGYGFALDDWRVAQTWKTLGGKLVHAAPNCRAEWWVLWRRIGGGLTAGQQTSLATPLLANIRQMHKQMTTGRGKGGAGLSDNTHEVAEIWRMLGSFELLALPVRMELGQMLSDLLHRPKLAAVQPALAWALGRIGARVPLAGPLSAVVPTRSAESWLPALFKLDDPSPAALLAVMQLSRKTDDRFRDVSTEMRERCLGWLDTNAAPAHFLTLVETGGRLDHEEQSLIFGEALPRGLRLGSTD